MKDKAIQYIFEYLEKEGCVDVLDQEFIDGFIEATGCKFIPYFWGAHTCRYAGKVLSELYHKGKLNRGVIGLGGNWMPGFPKWVYCYTLIKEDI